MRHELRQATSRNPRWGPPNDVCWFESVDFRLEVQRSIRGSPRGVPSEEAREVSLPMRVEECPKSRNPWIHSVIGSGGENSWFSEGGPLGGCRQGRGPFL